MATKYDPTTADPGQIEKIPAGQIVIDPNVRKDIRRDQSFVSSIRVLGFQQYPVGYRDGDHVHITVGQRRISAALEIGWDVVPVVVKPKREAEEARAEELRLLEQIAENEQRAALTPAELAAGYKELALLGVTEDQIARKTNAPKTTVQTALAVAASDVATAVLEARPITLEQAALLVEFEDDPEAVEQLTATLTERPEQIEHTAAQIREARRNTALVDAAAVELEAAGWIVHREKNHYGYSEPAGTRPLREVCRNGDDSQGIEPDAAGDLTDRHAVVYPYMGEARISHYVGNLEGNGLTLKSWYQRSSGKAPLSEAEKAERRQKRTDKADMITATEVRRNWIRTFLTLKKLPDTSRWTAHAVLQTADALGASGRDGNARDLAVKLVGVDLASMKYGYLDRTEGATLINDTPSLAPRLVLAYAIALAEDVLGDPKHPWAGMQHPQFAPYLVQLQEWGYTLADVEQRLVDAATPKHKKAAAA